MRSSNSFSFTATGRSSSSNNNNNINKNEGGNSSRKRNSTSSSRWGSSVTNNHNNNHNIAHASSSSSNNNNNNNNTNMVALTTSTTTATGCCAVSDEDAMRALLEETKAREDEKNKNRKLLLCNTSSTTRADHQQRQHTQQERQSNSPRKRTWDSNNNNNNNNNKEKQTKHSSTINDSYYGPSSIVSGNQPSTAGAGAAGRDGSEEVDTVGGEDDGKQRKMEKPDFGLSGLLAQDDTGGKTSSNVYKGVVLKFQEPPEGRAPKSTMWRLYVFKRNEQLHTFHISKQSAYLFGRNKEIADISIEHPSCSTQHAVLQYRALPTKENPLQLHVQPYLMDLESTNGTYINNVRIDSARYYQLKKGDVIKFGTSTREYVLLNS